MAEHVDDFGNKLTNVHEQWQCMSSINCTIHKPSYHHMRHMKQLWRNDKKFFERICEHGIGHPDPDEILDDHRMLNIHGCDGCCGEPNEKP